jgi:hypothetical protein
MRVSAPLVLALTPFELGAEESFALARQTVMKFLHAAKALGHSLAPRFASFQPLVVVIIVVGAV